MILTFTPGLGQAVAMLTSLLGRPRAVVVVITTWRTINVNKSTSYDTPKHLPTAYQGTHQSGERIHVAVRYSESEQITGLLQLHQERHVYGQTGGVLGVSLEDGRVQSHDCAVVASSETAQRQDEGEACELHLGVFLQRAAV